MNNIRQLKKSIDKLFMLNNNILLNNKDIYSLINQYNGTDWKKYVNLNYNNDYNKKFVLYGKDNLYDMYIITWINTCFSKIHNHSDNGCIMKLLNGKLEENLYDNKLNLINNKIIYNQDITYIDDNIGYHSLRNKNLNNYSVSLHIYSPSNFRTKYFN